MSEHAADPGPARGRAEALRGLCGGAVLLPGDGGYDAARVAGNLAADQRPAAIAYPLDAAEVAQVVRAAVDVGLRVAPQGTGHNAGPLVGLPDAVLLRTSGMVRTSVDPDRRLARVQAGVRWLEAVEAAAPYGLVAPHGSAPDVGVVGYCLGGGIGWYARTLGQHAHSLTAVEMVTAAGDLLRVDADHDAELFWALRGGGGSFGVVTAVEFGLFAIRTAYAGLLGWDVRHTGAVLRRWARWCDGAPDEVTSCLRIRRFAASAAVPPPLRGRRLVVVAGAVVGDEERARGLIAALRELRPEVDTFATRPSASLLSPRTGVGRPAPVVSDSALLTGLPADAVEALEAMVHSGGSDAAPEMVELRQLGGALARPAPGALPVLDARYLLFVSSAAGTPEEYDLGAANTARVLAALAPYRTGARYLNFATSPVDAATCFRPEVWSRLRAVRAAVDAGQVLLANHPVPPR